MTGKPNWRKRAVTAWTANFLAALPVAILIKLSILANNIWGTEGYESVHSVLLKSPLFFGSDILAAAVVALVASAAALPWLMLEKRRLALAAAIAVQAFHGSFSVVSCFASMYEGGFINKQAIDAALLEQAGELGDWVPALAKSVGSYVSFWSVTWLLFLTFLGGVVLVFAPKLVARWRTVKTRALRARTVACILAGETVLTMVILPFLMSGEIGGIRIRTWEMEKNPVVELGASYLRPLMKSFGPQRQRDGDPFIMDMTSVSTELASPATPLLPGIPKRTNVLLVVAESVGQTYLSWEEDPVPFLARGFKSRKGAMFEGHNASWSLTTKAHLALLCSELPYPSYKSITSINPGMPCRCLPEELGEQGYFTAYITSQDLAFDRRMRFLRHRGFDLTLDMNNMPGHETAWEGPWGIDDRVTVDAVLDVIREERAQPFFIVVETFAAHHPFLVAPEHKEYEQSERVQVYLRAIRFLDDRIRDLVEGVEEAGLGDETLIVIVADHGEAHGNHAGRNVYDPVIRVPMIILGPQVASGPLTIPHTTSHIDVAPTVLGLLGLEVPCTMKGRDLTQSTEQRFSLFGGRPPKFQLGVADGRWKFILEDESLEKLYDIYDDPGEMNNLAGEFPDVSRRYRDKVEEWQLYSENLIENYAEILAQHECGQQRKQQSEGESRR